MAMSCKYYSYFSSRTPFNDVQNILNKINIEKSLPKSYQDKIKYQNYFNTPKPSKISNRNDFITLNENSENEINYAQYQDQMQLKKTNAFHIQQQQEKYLDYLFAKEKHLSMNYQNDNNINEWLFTKFNNNYSEVYCKMFPNVYQNQTQENKVSNQEYIDESKKVKSQVSKDKIQHQYQYPYINEKLRNSSSYQYLYNHKLNVEFLNKYELIDELGCGGFGFVLLAKDIINDKKVAVKFIFKNKIPKSAWAHDEKEGDIPMECFIMKRINHPNIVKYLDSYSDPKLFYIVMELHGNTWATDENSVSNDGQVEYQNSMDLFECIESRAMRFTEFQAKYIFEQIFNAVKYLYEHGIVHRDLKDENILIDKHFNIKLADFGAASYLRNYNKNNAYFVNKFLGTLAYAPPEVLKGEQFGTIAQEVFSLGTILYLLIFGEIPFKSPEETLFSNNIYMNAPKNVSCSQEVLNLIEWMLQKRPEDRPSLDSILNHPWMRNNLI